MKLLPFFDSIFHHKGMIYFILGVILLFFLQKLPFIKKWFVFLNTLQHELVHIAAAGCFGGIPVGMEVNEHGGAACTTKSNFIVRLAPYVIPLFSLLILGISMLIKSPYRPVAFGMAGIFYGDFIVKTLCALNIQQTDIQKSGGRLLAYPIIFVSNLLILSAIGYMARGL